LLFGSLGVMVFKGTNKPTGNAMKIIDAQVHIWSQALVPTFGLHRKGRWSDRRSFDLVHQQEIELSRGATAKRAAGLGTGRPVSWAP
jgi:hypothetical protein